MVVQRRVGNSLTCPDGPLWFTRIRLTALFFPKLSPICRLSAGALRRPRVLTPPARPSQAVVTDALGDLVKEDARPKERLDDVLARDI
jgi:hypothetical protein